MMSFKAGLRCLPIALLAIMSTALVSRSATFTVNTTDDDVDVAPGDGICTTAGGTCTLRAAIQETNYLRRAAAAPLLTPVGGGA